ncbi:response regulator transcription factor [Brevibacillus agri]|uniref:response regulator transcription factor n=1 Tax=Brevibacillus agri TaxID=51101 RepID=UPI003D238A86
MRVLLVDDEPLELLNLRELLMNDHQPYSIRMAENGMDALQQLEQEPADLVFLDIHMPGMDGLTVLKEIKQTWPDTEVAMVSAYDTFAYAKEALECEATSYLLKPFSTTEFYSTLTRMKERWTTRMKLNPVVKQTLIEKSIFKTGNLPDADSWRSEFGFIPDVIVAVQCTHPCWQPIFEKHIGRLKGFLTPEPVGDIHVYVTFSQQLKELHEGLMRVESEIKEDRFYYGVGVSADLSEAYLTAHQHIHEKDRSVVKQCLRFLQENYALPLTLTEVAKAVHVSPSHLNRLLKKEVGVTFVDILTSVRIEKAKELLRKNYSIEAVSNLTGFNSSNYFAVSFKKATGVSPRTYRSELG